jgi:AraC family transcriptional activator of pobA
MKKLPIYGIAEFSEGENYFYANDLMTHLQSHQFVNNPHKHNTYICIFFTDGTGEHQIDFNSYKVKPGSIFLLNPGQVHCWKLSPNANGFVFFHTKDFYNNIYLNRKIEEFPFFYLSQNYPVVYVNLKEVDYYKNLFTEIKEEFQHDLAYKEIKLGSLVDLVYVGLSRKYKTEGNFQSAKNNNYFKLKQLQKFIDEHYKTKKLASEYADNMNMTTRHLSRICQEVLGRSTSDLITERIILEAKRLLIHSDISISNVADQLGYEDHSYFIRFFKKNTGLSPKEFHAKFSFPI